MMDFLFSKFISVAHAADSAVAKFVTGQNPGINKIPFVSSVGLNIQSCSATPDGAFLGCYIAALYTFFVQGAIVLAVVMVMFGGFQWLLAAGNSSKISEAKSTISAAIFGLILALTSYLLFAQINSKLVDLQDLTIEPVQIGFSVKAPEGFCPLSGVAPSFERINNSPSLMNPAQQVLTFHPSLIAVMKNLDTILKTEIFGVNLNSVTDGHIWPNNDTTNLCHRDKRNESYLGDCQHSDSYHYGGPANQCAFNAEHPPVSCAVDLAVSAIFYPRIEADMKKAGFNYVQCEKMVTLSSGRRETQKTDCIFSTAITHIHGELFGYPDPKHPENPYCYDLTNPPQK